MEHFSHLGIPFVPFDMDLSEVMISLCDMLVEIYSKIASLVSDTTTNVSHTSMIEMFAKLDARIRKLVLEPLFSEYEMIAQNNITNEIKELESLCTMATA